MKSFSWSSSSLVLLLVPESKRSPAKSERPALSPSSLGAEPITRLKDTLGILLFVERITFIPLSKSKTTGSAMLISGAAPGTGALERSICPYEKTDVNTTAIPINIFRSEERRVGKECRYRWSQENE